MAPSMARSSSSSLLPHSKARSGSDAGPRASPPAHQRRRDRDPVRRVRPDAADLLRDRGMRRIDGAEKPLILAPWPFLRRGPARQGHLNRRPSHLVWGGLARTLLLHHATSASTPLPLLRHVRDDLGGPVGWDLAFLALGRNPDRCRARNGTQPRERRDSAYPTTAGDLTGGAAWASTRPRPAPALLSPNPR